MAPFTKKLEPAIKQANPNNIYNVAFIPVSMPDENGNMSFGPAGQVCGPFLLETSETIILVVNPCVPYMMAD